MDYDLYEEEDQKQQFYEQEAKFILDYEVLEHQGAFKINSLQQSPEQKEIAINMTIKEQSFSLETDITRSYQELKDFHNKMKQELSHHIFPHFPQLNMIIKNDYSHLKWEMTQYLNKLYANPLMKSLKSFQIFFNPKVS